MAKTPEYCLNLEIKENIDNWLKHVYNPIYATICRIYETLEKSGKSETVLMSKEELTFFIHYTLENIRNIREITTLHPTHISYLAKKLGFYICDMNKLAHGTLKAEHISIWCYRILSNCCAILLHTDDPVLNNFANHALYVLSGMYIGGDTKQINKIKTFIKKMSTPETFQYAKKYSLADKFYIILDEAETSDFCFEDKTGAGCIYMGRDVSAVIQDTIIRICCDRLNERWVFNSHPYIHWENLINAMKATDDTAKIGQFLHRVVKDSSMESEIKQNIDAAITEKVDNVNEQVMIKALPHKFYFNFSGDAKVDIGTAETIVCDNHGLINF